MSNLVMATIGAQYPSAAAFTTASIEKMKSFITTSPSSTPSFWEATSVTDKRGFYNIAIIAYWPSTPYYEFWKSESGFGAWWRSPDHMAVFSNSEVPEGAANMREKISGEMGEHAYWADDRLESDKFVPDVKHGGTNGAHEGEKSKSMRVPGKKNLCVIRSGQNWFTTPPAERKLYLETMHPVLIKGMTFLRDEGKAIGCYANNLWNVVDSSTYEAIFEKMYGFKSHQTHLDIFGGVLMYAKKLNNVPSLRLFHETYVLEEDHRFFEYVGWHEETGMLNALRAGGA
ncbi:aldoxime dehydratase [Macroventuria anomochaeta]|uniref:Aldoxime dehydratase n=1 Tax=Macroventuria anomochaeta TaxID=301207 RepID=A0ACB6RR74_9PLEO|nr:aldoxime dehydratase [Macroventuria anomochaeta]KAF2623772.1 aldoxime dehydratase [Macroventuria anomochaeta]